VKKIRQLRPDCRSKIRHGDGDHPLQRNGGRNRFVARRSCSVWNLLSQVHNCLCTRSKIVRVRIHGECHGRSGRRRTRGCGRSEPVRKDPKGFGVLDDLPGRREATAGHHFPQRPSRKRTIAGLFGFLTLIQSRDGPDRYGAVSRFDTMPSKPSLQACRNTTAPSSSVCSLKTIPAGLRANSFASFALRALRA